MAVLSPARGVRVLIVDDCAVVREGLRMLLRSQVGVCVVGEAADGETALALVGKTQADVVLLDISLPGISGIETARRLRRLKPALRVLMISINDDLGHVLESFDAGAKGYIVKDSASDEIVEAVERVHAGGLFCSSSLRGMLRDEAGAGDDPRRLALVRALKA